MASIVSLLAYVSTPNQALELAPKCSSGDYNRLSSRVLDRSSVHSSGTVHALGSQDSHNQLRCEKLRSGWPRPIVSEFLE